MHTIEDVLGRDGVLSRAFPSYEYRPSQIAMAKHVNRALLEHVHLMVEAGTGTGKSFGYLVPALLSGQRVVISTATLALQEQLLTKDIPAMLGALDSSATVVLLKGRSNYLCRYKFDELRKQLTLAQSRDETRLFGWAARTSTGDRVELDFVPAAALWAEVDTDADECIMDACPYFGPERCFHMGAREAARHADIVVVNHALLFIDLALGGGLIPPYEYAILDEAHQMAEWATAAFSGAISRASVGRLLRKLKRAFVFPDALEHEMADAAASFSDALAAGAATRSRYALADNEGALELLDPLQRALYRAENWVAANWWKSARYPQAGEEVMDRKRELLTHSIVTHTQTIEKLRMAGEEWICWAERDGAAAADMTACCAPVSIAPLLRERLFDRTRSTIMTSATIAAGNDFTYLRRQVGLEDATVDEFVLDSPFDFVRQAALYLPPQRLNPKDPRFSTLAVPIVRDVLDATRGRAFVLFTSNAVMRAVAAAVGPDLPYPFRVQGDAPKGHLLAWFRSERNPVLFATASFWEGVDVVGDALSCVIIDRIPFPPPDDPVIAARARMLTERGVDAFDALFVPAAITRLKQGLGRLIRSTSDTGLMCVLDGRLMTMGYGRRILAALPPARRVNDLADVSPLLARTQ